MQYLCLSLLRDMANVSVGWEVEGIMSAEESVSGMLKVVETKNLQDTGTFWTWEGKVSSIQSLQRLPNLISPAISLVVNPWTGRIFHHERKIWREV